MTRPRLFPEPTTTESDASGDPNQRFDALAAKVLAVSKDEIDKRESEWRKTRKRKRVKRR